MGQDPTKPGSKRLLIPIEEVRKEGRSRVQDRTRF